MAIKFFCLLGFPQDVEAKIRNFIVKNAGDQPIEWVAANHNKLDGVIVNASFLQSPQIQKFMNKVSCPCVCAYSGRNASPVSQDTDIIALDISSPATTDSIWLSVLLGSSNKNTTTKSKETPANNADFSNEYEKLIEIIDLKEDICLQLKSGDKETWVLPAEQSAYVNYPRDQVSGIENWQWRKVDKEEMPGGLRKLRLEQWLFEAIWQSEQHEFKFEQQARFQLLRWPQPLSRHKRTEALRIAAQIKLLPSSVADLVDKTDYPDHVVKQFLYAAVKTGQIRRIDKPSSQKGAVASTFVPQKREVPPDPDRQLKMSFLSRLRKKLGL